MASAPTDPWLALARMLDAKLTWTSGQRPASPTYTNNGSITGRVGTLSLRVGLVEVGAELHEYARVHMDRSLALYATVEARAVARGCPGLRLRLHTGHVYPLGRALGIQDAQVGDAVFDDRFVVKTNDEAYLRTWLDAPARRALLSGDTFAYTLRDGLVVATGLAAEDHIERLAAGIRAVGTLAGSAQRLHDRYAALAAELGGRVVGDRVELGGKTRLEIPVGAQQQASAAIDLAYAPLGSARRHPRAWTRVRVARTDAARDLFSLARAGLKVALERRVRAADAIADYRVLAEDAPRLIARLTPKAQALLADTDPAAVLTERGHVQVYLDGLVRDAPRLGHAAELARTLAEDVVVPASGPYR